MSTSEPTPPHDAAPRPEPRLVPGTHDTAARDLPPELEATPEAWEVLLRGAAELHLPGALEQGVELRHTRRVVQPIVDSVLARERVVAALANVAPGEPAAVHAAHVALAAMCVAQPLGLPRASLADVGVAALLHDAGRAWAAAEPAADHTVEGVRRVLGCTTWSPLSLTVMQAAIAHHRKGEAPLVAQLVSAADAYVSLLASATHDEPWLSPAGALARVLGALRARWHPAIPPALVRALGLHPPGQVVKLDDGSIARALAPAVNDPARPWISRLVDARGLPVPAWASAPTPMPARRHVVRALPRHEWPESSRERPAA
ncbi:MAG TPA: HD domain-containing protein [Planctomycetota bacterium]|nr:HD domain-containing protein [Planctomycetota bacterium]